jgi:hypothetical protein
MQQLEIVPAAFWQNEAKMINVFKGGTKATPESARPAV